MISARPCTSKTKFYSTSSSCSSLVRFFLFVFRRFFAFNKSIASRVIRDEKCSTHQLPQRSSALRRFEIQPHVPSRFFTLSNELNIAFFIQRMISSGRMVNATPVATAGSMSPPLSVSRFQMRRRTSEVYICQMSIFKSKRNKGL